MRVEVGYLGGYMGNCVLVDFIPLFLSPTFVGEHGSSMCMCVGSLTHPKRGLICGYHFHVCRDWNFKFMNYGCPLWISENISLQFPIFICNMPILHDAFMSILNHMENTIARVHNNRFQLTSYIMLFMSATIDAKWRQIMQCTRSLKHPSPLAASSNL